MKRRYFLIHVCATAALLACSAQRSPVAKSSKALIAAVRAGDLHRVEKLLEESVSPDSRDEKGFPALALAASAKNAAIVKALLSKGADVHATTNNIAEKIIDVPVAWHAAALGSAETLRLILQAGAEPNTQDGKGISPLMAAAYLGNTETISVLIGAKADLEARDRKERTALMWAADGGRYEAARLLLDAGAKIEALGEQKASPLMYAAQHGYDDVLALLVERGADLNWKAEPGLTALDLAKQNNQELTIRLLENGGRQDPPVLEFQVLRPFLYPEAPLGSMFLKVVAKKDRIEAVRKLIVNGELRQARDILEAGREELRGQPLYLWVLAYLHQQLGDRKAALAAFREIVAAPDLGSRETLRVWKLIRDLGEAPPPDLSRRVLGVIVEAGLGSSVLVVAAYADGQPRFFLSTGGGVIGERWTDEEVQKVQEIVRLAQELLPAMLPTEDRELPKPGRVRFIFLTPEGSYGAEDSLAFLNHWQGRYAKIFNLSDQLFGMLWKHYQEQDNNKPGS